MAKLLGLGRLDSRIGSVPVHDPPLYYVLLLVFAIWVQVCVCSEIEPISEMFDSLTRIISFESFQTWAWQRQAANCKVI